MFIKVKKPRFRSKVALFDYDWTLVRPKNEQTFPKDVDDWQWLHTSVPDIITKYHKKGFGIYIVTNQTKKWKQEQIEQVLKSLDIPIHICIAWTKEERKPSTFLYDEAFTKEQKEKLKLAESFFCGDALGRTNDHSADDSQFAKNIGIKCFSPEEIFLLKKDKKKVLDIQAKKTQEIVIMVGYPGSGKSTLCSKVFEGNDRYFIAHGDDLKTSAKMIKAGESFILQGKSVVFDATNPSKRKRAEYVDLAKKHNIPVRCIYVNTNLQESLVRNNNREKVVPRIVYNVYAKNFEMPEETEGFQVLIN
jgi:bifunctional polynucleotide phosphatase/kinase